MTLSAMSVSIAGTLKPVADVDVVSLSSEPESVDVEDEEVLVEELEDELTRCAGTRLTT